MHTFPLPSVEKLRASLNYDPMTGSLTWKVRVYRSSIRPGSEAGGGRVYRYMNFYGTQYLVHRIIWKMMTGDDPVGVIDHKDGNAANNRWDNLRQASHSQNNRNRKRAKNSTSGVKGVSWDALHKSWRAVVHADKKNHFLGYFPEISAATDAVNAARARIHGEFARSA